MPGASSRASGIRTARRRPVARRSAAAVDEARELAVVQELVDRRAGDAARERTRVFDAVKLHRLEPLCPAPDARLMLLRLKRHYDLSRLASGLLGRFVW